MNTQTLHGNVERIMHYASKTDVPLMTTMETNTTFVCRGDIAVTTVSPAQ